MRAEPLMSFLRETFHVFSQSIAGRIKHLLCYSTGKALLGAYAWFFQIVPYVCSPFVDVVLCHFSVRGHSMMITIC